jgi:hypothetical protein
MEGIEVGTVLGIEEGVKLGWKLKLGAGLVVGNRSSVGFILSERRVLGLLDG